MSYAIGNIIYGIPITSEGLEELEEELDHLQIDLKEYLEDAGFEMLYSAGGIEPIGYCGIELGTIDECAEPMLLSELHKYRPSYEQVQQAQAKIEKVSAEVREKFPIADIYLVWSSS